jgi:endonuclease/exonuclease/phosphatase family metal-dependent hydrolase
MFMQLTTVQWNIGGGKIRDTDSDATLPASYRLDGLAHIYETLKDISPDIITLQETHAADGTNQTQVLAERLGYNYWTNDEYADSHVEDGFRLGQGIISRYPIKNHQFQMFYNPHYQAEWEEGVVTSHDKGITSCDIDINGQTLNLMTLHAIPFRPFNIDPLSEAAREVREDMQSKIQSDSELMLLQGDFNYDEKSLESLLPSIFKPKLYEALQSRPTTPKGRFYDHVVYRGLKLESSSADDSKFTDHYPVISKFELSGS